MTDKVYLEYAFINLKFSNLVWSSNKFDGESEFWLALLNIKHNLI